jgi:electron transfer flavoprotein alpha subunit
MSGILVIAESRRGELRDVSLELIGAALQVKEDAGGRLAVAAIGAGADQHAAALGADGVDEVLTVDAPSEHFEPHVHAAAVETLIEQEQPALVLVGHTIDSLGFGPALAARRGLGLATDVTRLAWDGGPVATRGGYGGKVDVELDFPGKDCVLLMLRAGAFPPAAPGSGAAAARAVDVQAESQSEHVGFREVETADVDITKAEFLLSIGRGVEDKDAIEQFEELAEKMGATLSVSRPLVDAGWVPNARQVGQSGKTVKPKVYLALGISGAVQHLAGMQTAETIIAVNTDPEAPIFNVAHYGAVADLFDVADELAEQFEE